VLFGAGGATATSLALCTTSISAPTTSPSSTTAGTPITYTATVTASSGCLNGSPTGTVTFYSNYLVSGQPASFQIGSPVTLQPSGTGTSTATLVDHSLPAGTYAITASYTSDDETRFWDAGPSSGASVVIQSNALNTTTMDFTATPSTITVGQSIAFHVHITAVDVNGNPLSTVPTGSVEFSAGPTAASGQSHFASYTLDSTGSVDFSYAGFVTSDTIVIATYTGDPVDKGIFGQLPIDVLPGLAPAATTTSVVANPSSIDTGESSTFTAHVVESASQTPVPSGGTVDFYAGPDATSLQLEGVGTTDANGDAQISAANFQTGSYVVRAQYLADTRDSLNTTAGSFGDTSLLVSTPAGTGNAAPTTLTYTGDVEAAHGAQATLAGHLVGAGAPLSGEPLTLTLGSQSCTTGPTDGSGNASCQVTVTADAGAASASAHFAGDRNWSASDASAPFTVDAVPTAIAYTGSTSGATGSPATLSAHLTANGSDLAGEPVTLSVGAQQCTGTTDSTGTAGCSITLNEAPGTYPIVTSFPGDTNYLASRDGGTFTVGPAATTTTYTGATQGAHGATATLSAHVSGAPDGASVGFAVGTQSCSGTLAGGDASCTVTLVDAPGSGYTVTAGYAGDGSHLPSSDSKPFTIVSPVTTTKAGPLAPVLAGAAATLSATVTPAAATGAVTFSTGGTTLCTATLSNGAASCSATLSQPGSYVVTASYGGDGVYPPSSGTTTVIVYALAPGGGSFVVGDKSAAGSVTFWGSQWAKTNSLSGGNAPNAFKGFALNAGATCGVAWRTDPGNSSPPPAGPLPAYMAVIVTTKATKSGPQISGTIAAIVIVKTNAGYDANPGHAGTGTVVATVCGG
jgi:hypothetical protein